MLPQVQKPRLRYATSARDWLIRFGQKPVEGARPPLILWLFDPVAPVYDVIDTEGRCPTGRASGVFDTQREAGQRAKEIVGNLGGCEVRIQGRDGHWRNSDTVPPEVWNRLGTKILPKLRSGSDLRVGVDLAVTVDRDAANTLISELRQVLEDLGVRDRISIEAVKPSSSLTDSPQREQDGGGGSPQ